MKLTILAGQAEKLAGLMTMTAGTNEYRQELRGVWLQVSGSDGGDVTGIAT